LQKAFIPDEMRVLVVTFESGEMLGVSGEMLGVSGEMLFEFKMSCDLQDVSGVKYRFYVSNDPSGNDEIMKEVVGNEDGTFTFDKEYENVYCYGKEVDDFHILDKAKIFSLHHSAIQEIDRKQLADEATIIAQAVTIVSLEDKVVSLEADLASIKAHLGL